MNLVLSNYHYRPKNAGGGNLHIDAFIRHALGEGHALYSWPCCRHPGIRPIPNHIVGQWRYLSTADLHYVRLQEAYPRRHFSRWYTPPLRWSIPRPPLVWEFNTIPEQGADIGQQPWEIDLNKQAFRRAAGYCDLAVCVSKDISSYVRKEFRIANTIVIPNGGYLRPVPRPRIPGFHAVWAGSGDIGWHDFELLIHAARLLPGLPGGDQITIHLYGTGTDQLRDLPSNIHVHGALPHPELTDRLASMHVGLCLYRKGPADYSSPLKFYDYLASGLPVITTPHPQMTLVQLEMLSSDLEVGDRSPECLARILVSLASDLKRVKELSTRASRLIEQRYAWPILMGELFRHLKRLVPNPGQ